MNFVDYLNVYVLSTTGVLIFSMSLVVSVFFFKFADGTHLQKDHFFLSFMGIFIVFFSFIFFLGLQQTNKPKEIEEVRKNLSSISSEKDKMYLRDIFNKISSDGKVNHYEFLYFRGEMDTILKIDREASDISRLKEAL